MGLRDERLHHTPAGLNPDLLTLGMSTNLAYLTNTFDPHTGALTDQLVTRSTTPAKVDEQNYTHDPAGNTTKQVTTRLGATAAPETQCNQYDELDRLTQAWTATDDCGAVPTTSSHAQVGDLLAGGTAYWTSWDFDALGQRQHQVEHSTTGGSDTTTGYTYDYNGNSAVQPHALASTQASGASTATTSYTYDKAGNTTGRNTIASGNQALTWNDAGQLTQVSGGKSGTTGYIYDADGNVLLQTDPTSTTLYLPGEQLTLTGTTTTGVRYLPLPGGGAVVRTGTGANYKFEVGDPHGSSGLYLDSTAQTPTWRQFTPYGGTRGTTVSWLDNRGFLNAPDNANTGLTQLGARQYDPTLGRFTSLDPLFEATDDQQLAGYAYAAGNPITKSDPSGLCADIDCPTRPGPGYENAAPGHVPSGRKSGNTIAAENGECYNCAKPGTHHGAVALPGIDTPICGIYPCLPGFKLNLGDKPLHVHAPTLSHEIFQIVKNVLSKVLSEPERTEGCGETPTTVLCDVQGGTFAGGPLGAGKGGAGRVTPQVKGAIGEARAAQELQDRGYKIMGTHVQLESKRGVTSYVDIIATRNGNGLGAPEYFEVKNGPGASLSPQQKTVYGQLSEEGGVILRSDMMIDWGLKSGDLLPRADVNVILYGGAKAW